MLALSLFGPPTLRRDGVEIALPIRKSMALLLLLARQAAAVPRGRVAALLWPELGETVARRNLRRELARLREAGAGDALRVEGDRLALDAGVACDLAAFEAEFAAGRLDEALALWRGAPVDGFALGDADAFDDWLAAERERLAELRRRALHDSAAAREACGDLEGALDRVQSLLADDPLQEQHHRDAMRLLAATGRREAALAQFDRCRTALRTELGLAPMAETEALAVALRGTAAALPRANPPVPAAAPTAASRPTSLPEQLPFVGRDAEVAALEAAWAAGRTMVIEAEGGLGKTRLATDFAAAHGPYALARCRSGDAEVPYASFARALRALLGPSPALPTTLPSWIAPEMARLLPELGASAAPLRNDEERNRFFEACAQAWLALSHDDFDAVVVDDWHLADAASRVLFAFVARRRHEAGSGGAREIVVLRPDLDTAAADALASLLASSGATHLRLRALSEGEILELVRRLSGAGEPARFAARLARATGGNPFFLAETLRHLGEAGLVTLDAEGAWQTPFDASTEDYREMPVPVSVHEAVRSRAARLAPATRRVLEAAALAAEPFGPRLLAPACALSELDAVLAIEEAVGARLLREHEHGGFAFAHDLVQQSLAAALSTERARLIHRRLALGGEAAGASPAKIAAHHEASGEPERAVVHRIAAGDESRRLRALPEAIAQWTKALGDKPTAAQAVAIHDRLCKVAYERTEFAVVREQAEALGRLLEGSELDAAGRVDAAIARALALGRGGNGGAALAVLDALPGEPVGRQRFNAHWARAVACYELSRTEQATACVRSALALPELADADRIDLLDFAFLCEFNAGHNDAALAHADTALALARRLGGGGSETARNHLRRGILLLSAHDMASAERELLTAAREAERLGIVHIERISLYNLTCAYASQGRHEDALAAADRGWNLAPPLEASDFRVMYLLARVDAQFALGDIGASWRAAAPAIEEALTLQDPRVSIGAVACTLELLGMVGEVALARRLLATVGVAAARDLKAAADEMWIALAQFELRHGETDAAVRALAEFDATGDAVVARVGARAAQARAELALVEDDPRHALALLPADDALGMNGEMRTRGLALRVRAEIRLGALTDSSRAAADRALAGACDHEIARLELSAAVAQAASEAAAVPAATTERHAALVGRLADTLRQHPPQRAAFLRAWPA